MSNTYIESKMGMKCSEIAQATAARLLGKEYQYMFADCWGFCFVKEDTVRNINYSSNKDILLKYKDTLGIRLAVGRDRIDINLEKYHGVRTERFEVCDARLCLEVVKQSLFSKKYVGIWYDQYFMPWAKEMRKKAPLRYDGFLMIVNYDIKKEVFLCIDIHGSRKAEELPILEFEKFLASGNSFNYMIYSMSDIESTSFCIEENINNLFKRARLDEKDNIFTQMRETAYLVKETFDLKLEEEFSLLFAEQLSAPTHIEGVKRLRDIARMRNLYSITLQHAASKCNIFGLMDFADELNVLASNWQAIVSVILKAYYKNDLRNLKANVSSMILKCADEEEIFINRLVEKIGDASKQNTERYLVRKTAGSQNRVCQILLKDYYNARAFAFDESNEANADFDDCGNFYLVPVDARIASEFIEYQTVYSGFDNITCDGQAIKIEKIGTKIVIVGACDTGAYYAKLGIEYSGGEYEEKIFGFGEWRFEKCELGESVIWSGNRVMNGTIPKEEKSYVFQFIIETHKSEYIKKVILPQNPCVHIFAIGIIN